MNGSLNYEVLGWSLKKTDIFALIPITVANGVAFFVLLAAMCLAKRGDKCPSPWDSRPVAYDPEFGEEVPDEWATQIVLDPVTVRNLIWNGLTPADLIMVLALKKRW